MRIVHRLGTRFLLAGLLMTVVAGCGLVGGGDDATAINAPYGINFDGTGLSGWLFYDPLDPNTAPSANVNTLWQADGSPLNMPGGSSYSGGVSLNYNNGNSYLGHNAGIAISPKIDLSALSNPVLFFRCNYETETTGTNFDERHVGVGYLDGSNNPVMHVQAELSSTPGSPVAGPCAGMGQWHNHAIALNPQWGKVRAAFGFDTKDSLDNDYRGWFVDDFYIVEYGQAQTLAAGGTINLAAPPVAAPPVFTPPSSGSVFLNSDFDGTNGLFGWSISGNGNSVAWAADGTPSSFPGGIAAGGAKSLNFNNGATYDTGGTVQGSAITPTVDLTGPAVLSFQCNYDLEAGAESVAYDWDERSVGIYSASVAYYVAEQEMGVDAIGPFGACASSGAWHTHTIALDPAWGLIYVEFYFDTVDDFDNGHAGWAIDNVVIAANVPAGGTGNGSATGTGTGIALPPITIPLPPIFGIPLPPVTITPPPIPLPGGITTGNPNPPPTNTSPPVIVPPTIPTTNPNAPTADQPALSGLKVYMTGFDKAEEISGWQYVNGDGNVSDLAAGTNEVTWAADGSPAGFPGGAKVYVSEPSSLNFNDGQNYNNGQPVAGSALSPSITIAQYNEPVLTFSCNFEAEAGSQDANYTLGDHRVLQVLADGVATPVLEAKFGTINGSPFVGNCAAMGAWHTHTVVLDPAWNKIRVRFHFDSLDQYNNYHAGWAIDDFSVTAKSANPVAASAQPAAGGSSGGSNCGGSLAGAASSSALPLAFGAMLFLAASFRRRRN